MPRVIREDGQNIVVNTSTAGVMQAEGDRSPLCCSKRREIAALESPEQGPTVRKSLTGAFNEVPSSSVQPMNMSVDISGALTIRVTANSAFFHEEAAAIRAAKGSPTAPDIQGIQWGSTAGCCQ